MNLLHVARSSAFALVLGVAGIASANPAAKAERCELNPNYSAVSIAPFRADENFGLGSYTTLQGVQVYVQAKPGLTAEWLTLSVQHELNRLSKSEDAACQPPVSGDMKVTVASAGGGFWVYISTPDQRSAASLLRWAHNIVPAQK